MTETELQRLCQRLSVACRRCAGHGRLQLCNGCDSTYKYSSCANAACEGERSTEVACGDCSGAGRVLPAEVQVLVDEVRRLLSVVRQMQSGFTEGGGV